ncbi:MAG TPA: AMP-binding protein [Candidatus Competibacteraceae bacterium]|nr:AMP-binding protein [Candidatus Competibacteraceae bacterium]
MIAYELETIVALARARAPYYRTLYARLPESGWTLTDLPLVDSKTFWEAAEDGAVLTGRMTDGVAFKSGGTTGKPKFSIYRVGEWDSFCEVFGRGMAAGGLRPGERLANLFYAGDLYASFLFITHSLERSGVPVVHFPLAGRVDADMLHHTIAHFAVETLAGVPTTLLGLAATLAEGGVTLPSVRRILFGGETLYPDQAVTLQRVFSNARTASIGYASVDAGLLGYASPDCGWNEHRVFGTATLVEIVDEGSGEPINEPGRPGKVLITNLTRLLMPVIRYPAGDRAEWVEPEGAPERKFRLLGRSEEGARIGVVSLYFEDVHALLEPFQHELRASGFQLLIRHHDQRDELTVRIAASPPAETQAVWHARLTEALYAARPMLREEQQRGMIHPPRFEWVGSGALEINPRTGKLKPIIDRRMTG